MPALGYYTNVHNTALVILRGKGFRVWRDRKSDLICAEKNGWDFMAYDPVQLLGLVSIYEIHQPKEFHEYWWKIDKPWLSDRVPVRRPRFVPVFERKSRSTPVLMAKGKLSASKKMEKLGSLRKKA